MVEERAQGAGRRAEGRGDCRRRLRQQCFLACVQHHVRREALGCGSIALAFQLVEDTLEDAMWDRRGVWADRAHAFVQWARGRNEPGARS